MRSVNNIKGHKVTSLSALAGLGFMIVQFLRGDMTLASIGYEDMMNVAFCILLLFSKDPHK